MMKSKLYTKQLSISHAITSRVDKVAKPLDNENNVVTVSFSILLDKL